MSDREKIKQLIFKEFPNGYQRVPYGYCTYIRWDGENYKVENFTSGMHLRNGEFTIPPKYYESPQEMFDDIKLYFNPKEK